MRELVKLRRTSRLLGRRPKGVGGLGDLAYVGIADPHPDGLGASPGEAPGAGPAGRGPAVPPGVPPPPARGRARHRPAPAVPVSRTSTGVAAILAGRRKAELLRAELGGPDPSPLERLVVGRVVASWLAVYYAEAFVAQGTGLTVRQADLWQRRIDRAHARLLSAARALAAVRRLELAVVLTQVDVATADLTALELGHS